MSSFARRFDRNLQSLNAQFWLLRVAASQTAGSAVSFEILNGIELSRFVAIAFPFAEERTKIRLRTKYSSHDLAALAHETHSWLPAYFAILTRAMAERTISEIIQQAVRQTPERKTQFNAFRRRKARERAQKPSAALQLLAGSVVRGDFEVLSSAFALNIGEGVSETELNRLKAENRARNKIAHELDLNGGHAPTTVRSWELYSGTLQRLVHRVEDRM